MNTFEKLDKFEKLVAKVTDNKASRRVICDSAKTNKNYGKRQWNGYFTFKKLV